MKKVILVLIVLCLAVPVFARDLFLQTKSQNQPPASGQPSQANSSFAIQKFSLKYANAKDARDMLTNLLADGEGVSVNEKLNMLVLRASAKTIANVASLVKQLDVPPLQVHVEAKIIMLKNGNGDANNPTTMGPSWKFLNKGNVNDYVQLLTTQTLTMAASSLGLYAQVLSGNYNAYLDAIEKKIGYDLIASPWVTALNNEEAQILIGSKYGYRTLTVTQTSTTQNVEFLEVGTKLKFTPRINDDGYIVMDILPSVSEGSVTNDLPSEDTTETRNKVLVKDGQSIVIGGLTKRYDTVTDIGVPILQHIPFIGMLFRRTQILSEKRDLMVIVTPHIVTPEFLSAMAEKAEKMEKEANKKAQGATLVR
ncbi:hypothetical protein A2276_04755 [candidate division WOR-1 bacterium RIFOXYA12_FULL_43_27]|uniref:Uncharacterized protein n=1 Tax=candidate division WOR-1 bacterium RIFOXYC2_FULL_46_14 TaxID=1802587 RepID=A0A1F4U2Q9_UNCSA|nr:MAG: hypothetical protein A2276_04755 [candidate division WOR-1 bacterium RIFOXYA12_FULL_43_27]OGC18865.1 MAG: hypothetical protein A2292_08080 [candidate division WOR-1 bacterium RIFOXYB2_FULL_46_45]OGC29006.1 MAG: hypothetical protein A2232_03145 [candidate division WOR-1 bacterium RIFOXYA2_FULL_46_56]OGC39265.1 MAG: hypothetical protein A2438_07045 [candidate division WOR-1 bacterium RIFOXYC2_FULL_46_14]